MAFRTQKISQMTPKGSDLEATDLIEVSTIESGSYVTRSITGQELIDAIPLPPSGITIGTTLITSGTVGRVLFQGSGNVVQESANLFWDNTNVRLGIGTSSPTTSLMMQQNGGGFIRMVRNLSTTEFTLGITNVRLGAGPAGGVFTANHYEFRDSAGTAAFLNINNGNVLINTTTDAGFKLDVNGTARVVNNSFFATSAGSADGGNGVGIGTTTLGTLDPNQRIVLVSSGLFPSYKLSASGGNTRGFIGLNGNNNALNIGTDTSTYLALFSANAERMRIFTTGNIGINTTTDAGFKLDVNGTARVKGTGTGGGTFALTVQNSASTNIMRLQDDGYLNVTAGVFTSAVRGVNVEFTNLLYGANFWCTVDGSIKIGSGQSASVASAIFQADSTTRGFLPPRMTTTQKNAIATPATGLQIFDTTLNRPCFYDGTTWITL